MWDTLYSPAPWSKRVEIAQKLYIYYNMRDPDNTVFSDAMVDRLESVHANLRSVLAGRAASSRVGAGEGHFLTLLTRVYSDHASDITVDFTDRRGHAAMVGWDEQSGRLQWPVRLFAAPGSQHVHPSDEIVAYVQSLAHAMGIPLQSGPCADAEAWGAGQASGDPCGLMHTAPQGSREWSGVDWSHTTASNPVPTAAILLIAACISMAVGAGICWARPCRRVFTWVCLWSLLITLLATVVSALDRSSAADAEPAMFYPGNLSIQ